jgi:hypothetical protein
MKDKLEKTGHKKFYYRLKSLFTVLMFSIAIAAVAAIPVGISYRLAAAQAKGEDESSDSNPTTSVSSDVDDSISSLD